MRFTILLTLCVLGVASAGSLNKRGLAEDLQSQSQNAMKAFQDFSEQAKHNAEEALKKLMDFFNQFNKKPEAEKTEEKVVEKRDLAENIQKLTGQAKENFEKNLKALMDFFNQFNKQPSQASAPVESESEKVVEKRDLAENIQKLTGQAKENFEKNLKALMDFFNQFNKQPSQASATVESAPVESAESEVKTVVKRKVTAGDLVANLGNPKKLQELLVEVLITSMAGKAKRDVGEEIQKLTGQAKESFEKNLKALMDFFNQFNKKPEAEKTEEKTVEKRENNPMEMIEKFLKDAQSKAMNAGSELQKAFEQFLAQFQKKDSAPQEEVAAPAA